jgi:acetyl esterase
MKKHITLLFLKLVRWLFDCSNVIIGPPKQMLLSIRDIHLNDFSLRIYTPSHEKNLPIFLFYHGGGWTIGSVKAYDRICQYVSYNANCIVVSVNYRLAPEHPFPAATTDALNAYNWVREHAEDISGDKNRIIIGGDSAGGNLAAIVTHSLKERKPILQVLIYPVLDLRDKIINKGEKIARKLPLFYRILWHQMGLYLEETKDYTHKHISPLVNETYDHLPPTLIITAEIDILVEEAKKYAEQLKQAGVPVTYKAYSKVPHGFIQFSGMSKKAKEALDEIIEEIRKH